MEGRPAPLVVAVVGSPRPRGNSSLLTDVALEELEQRGCRVEKVMLGGGRLLPCLGHDDCSTRHCPLGDDGEAVLDLVYRADGLLLATPVYYENVSAQMKAFIDRNQRRYAREQWLRAGVVGLLAVTAETGLDDAYQALRRYVELSVDHAVTYLTAGGLAEAMGAAAADEELVAAARGLGRDMAHALRGSVP
jgi:multimeric flavodoxin WrbA